MSTRIDQELDLIRSAYKKLDYQDQGQWLRIRGFVVPPEGGWKTSRVTLAFQFPAGYPGQKPYGFYVTPPLELSSGAAVNNVTPSNEPPWPGPWLKFSWDVPDWRPTADLSTGFNMLNYILTIADRLKQGA